MVSNTKVATKKIQICAGLSRNDDHLFVEEPQLKANKHSYHLISTVDSNAYIKTNSVHERQASSFSDGFQISKGNN